MQAIRGATTVKSNSSKEIIEATKDLLLKLLSANKIKKENISAIIFSATSDLTAIAPAAAARELGWRNLALLCTQEMKVKNNLKRCIRVLIFISTKKNKIQHLYLKEAKKLRPDIAHAE